MKIIFWSLSFAFLVSCNPEPRPTPPRDTQNIILPATIVEQEGFSLSNELVPFWENKSKKWGYKNRITNKETLTPRYTTAGVFQGGVAYAIGLEENGALKIVQINSKGDEHIVLQREKQGDIANEILIEQLSSKIIVVRTQNDFVLFSQETGQVREFGEAIRQYYSMGREGILLQKAEEWTFYDPKLEAITIFKTEDWEILIGSQAVYESSDYLPALKVKSVKTGKMGLVDFAGQFLIEPIFDNISYPSRDSLVVIEKVGKQFLFRMPKYIQASLPDSVHPWSTARAFCKYHQVLIVENEASSMEYSDYAFLSNTGELKLLPSNSWAKLADDRFSFRKKGKIFLANCLGEEAPFDQVNSISGSSGIIGENANGYPMFHFLLDNKRGAINSEGSKIIPPTFDKIDIGESPWRSDFPYIVAERDSGSFKEVYLFGIEGDTLAGPMRLKAWDRGSAYNHLGHRGHVLNHSDWRGTPKEEMLFYIEWEDADSVLHKGYIDFFGHLYE